jgi:hypothetical protein
LEAWNGRGRGDHLGSHDLEDVINLVDGREEIVAEVAAAPNELRTYLASEITALLAQQRFRDTLDGTIVGLGDGRRASGPARSRCPVDAVDEPVHIGCGLFDFGRREARGLGQLSRVDRWPLWQHRDRRRPWVLVAERGDHGDVADLTAGA